jgi:hypothetical protein
MKSPSRRLAVTAVLLLSAFTWGATAMAQPTGTPVPAKPPAESPTEFCWSETWGRGLGTIPLSCRSDQELNGLLCYPKCQDGYTSNRVAGCIQNCPQGSSDDGLFCGWASYKAAEYPEWDKAKCESKHGSCWHSGLLWVESCKPGYKHVLGFCEVESLDCGKLGLAGNRIANSCAKKTYGRAAASPGCGEKELDAGLCYDYCGKGSGGAGATDGIGPVCWAGGPPGWVQCGMGYAKDKAACDRNITDQVLTVVDATLTTAVLIGSAGASAATKAGTSVWSKAAWQGVKKIGKKAVKDALKEAVLSNVATGAADIAMDSASSAVDYLWEIGELEESNMTKVEKDHAIAQMALNAVSWLDPTGFSGVVAAYTKPICKDIAANNPPKKEPSGALYQLASAPQSIEMPLTRQRTQTKAEYDGLTAQVNQLEAAYNAVPAAQKPALQAAIVPLRARQAVAKADLDRVTAAYQKFQTIKPKLGQLSAVRPAVRPAVTPTRPRPKRAIID